MTATFVSLRARALSYQHAKSKVALSVAVASAFLDHISVMARASMVTRAGDLTALMALMNFLIHAARQGCMMIIYVTRLNTAKMLLRVTMARKALASTLQQDLTAMAV